jgi:hypothetical protein
MTIASIFNGVTGLALQEGISADMGMPPCAPEKPALTVTPEMIEAAAKVVRAELENDISHGMSLIVAKSALLAALKVSGDVVKDPS